MRKAMIPSVRSCGSEAPTRAPVSRVPHVARPLAVRRTLMLDHGRFAKVAGGRQRVGSHGTREKPERREGEMCLVVHQSEAIKILRKLFIHGAHIINNDKGRPLPQGAGDFYI
jgi:hypothetical protein